MQNACDKMLYDGDTKFSYKACQWVEAESKKLGEHIHNKMCGHGGERQVYCKWTDHEGETQTGIFQSMGMSRRLVLCINIMGASGTGADVRKIGVRDRWIDSLQPN